MTALKNRRGSDTPPTVGEFVSDPRNGKVWELERIDRHRPVAGQTEGDISYLHIRGLTSLGRPVRKSVILMEYIGFRLERPAPESEKKS